MREMMEVRRRQQGDQENGGGQEEKVGTSKGQKENRDRERTIMDRISISKHQASMAL